MCVFPGFVIPWNGSVKILCRGTSESFLYQLFILENSTHKVVEEKIGFQKEAAFVISPMNESTAGRYGCRYRKGYRWSEQSKTLQLKVSGKKSQWPSPQLTLLPLFLSTLIYENVFRFTDKLRQCWRVFPI
jgi:hypothetical protein